MALTIDDIYDKEFALKGGGYDRNDVDRLSLIHISEPTRH